jgi:hypothetical protein
MIPKILIQLFEDLSVVHIKFVDFKRLFGLNIALFSSFMV